MENDELRVKLEDIIQIVAPKQHNELLGLDYESSGHIGFASSKDIQDLQNEDTNIRNEIQNVKREIQGGVVSGIKGSAESVYRKGLVNITKANIGLGNVDNTSDLDKPISRAVQFILNTKEDIANLKALAYKDSLKKSEVGLGNVDNTSDLDKPLSKAIIEALKLKEDKSNLGTLAYRDKLTKNEIGLGNVNNVAITQEQVSQIELNKNNISSNINDIDSIYSQLLNKVGVDKLGIANGVATLDSDGKVPSTQLPSYVDDVLEFGTKNLFPLAGESNKIYLDLTTNKAYRWSGTTYVEISPQIALGETNSTAYPGNKGKENAENIAKIISGEIILDKYLPKTGGVINGELKVGDVAYSNYISIKQNWIEMYYQGIQKLFINQSKMQFFDRTGTSKGNIDFEDGAFFGGYAIFDNIIVKNTGLNIYFQEEKGGYGFEPFNLNPVIYNNVGRFLEISTNGKKYKYTLPEKNGEVAMLDDVDTKIASAIESSITNVLLGEY